MLWSFFAVAIFVECNMSSVSRPIKGKENLNSRNIQVKSKTRGGTTLHVRPDARTFGEYV